MSRRSSAADADFISYLWRAIEIAAVMVFVLCTALLLILRWTRVVVVLGIEALCLAGVVAGVVSYVLGELGLL